MSGRLTERREAGQLTTIPEGWTAYALERRTATGGASISGHVGKGVTAYFWFHDTKRNCVVVYPETLEEAVAWCDKMAPTFGGWRETKEREDT